MISVLGSLFMLGLLLDRVARLNWGAFVGHGSLSVGLFKY